MAGFSLAPGARRCVENFAGVKHDDSVLILSDDEGIADALAHAIRTGEASAQAEVDVSLLTPAMRPVRRMPLSLRSSFDAASIVFVVLTSYSTDGAGFFDEERDLRHEIVTRVGPEQRVFNMLGVTKGTFKGQGPLALEPAEIEAMERLTHDYAVALTLARTARIVVEAKGSDLRLDLGDAENVGNMSTGRLAPGTWGNLPSGEAFILPAHATGRLVVDKAISNLPEIDDVALELREDKIVVLDETSPLHHAMEEYERHAKPAEFGNVRRVCEFGIGTNPRARSHQFIEIEKIRGTIHVAVGGNKPFQGKISAPNHTDMVVSHPTVWLDGEYAVVKDGKVHAPTLGAFLAATEVGGDGAAIPHDAYVVPHHDRVVDDGEALHRRWLDGRRRRLSVPVGPPELAPACRELWRCFEGSGKPLKVRDLRSELAKSAAWQEADDTVDRLLRSWRRYGIATVGALGAGGSR